MFKKILLVLLVFVTAFTLVACKKDKVVDTLVLQSAEMDGVFNPFFYSSAYDEQVISLVHTGLLSLDPKGAVVAGDKYPTVALDYSIFYTNNLSTYAEKAKYEQGDYVVYEMVIKNGMKFSDGTAITADDVLFNYYTYLDPAYVGSSTLYTLPILGLKEFRSQVADPSVFDPIVEAILADNLRGEDYVATDAYTETQFNSYWEIFNNAGKEFAQEIINYVNANYAKDDVVEKNFKAGVKYETIKASEGLKVAYGMAVWGFGDVSDDLQSFTTANGNEFAVNDLNAEVYFEEIIEAYEYDYQEASEVETAGSDFVAVAKERFVSASGVLGSVPSITGLSKGTKTIDGVSYETVKVVLTEKNPKAILSIGVTVAPKHYYTAGYTYGQSTVKNFGVEYNTKEFMDHLATFNAAPLGAGPYKFKGRDSGDGTVHLVSNTNFETMGGPNVHNPYIKKVAVKIVEGGAEYNALEAGTVHYATVSATSDVTSDIAKQKKLAPILVDNLGYGYIAVNPQVYNNLHTRIAIQSVFDLAKVYEYYPNGLADVIYRSQSQVSWSYPEGATAVYPFDETLAKAIAEFKLAGYNYDETTKKFTNVPQIDFTIPSQADSHPAGGIFLKAKELLATIGVTAEVKVDAQLIANIKKGPVGVYALAWQSSADPDMYQVYHYESQAESVVSNGIKWLQENGNNDLLGTIEVTKLDGSKVNMNQAQALEYLAQLIEEGTQYMLAEERKPIYQKALEVLAQLSIEVPTYQRKNLFVYNSEIIDGTSLSSEITPYWGPLAEVWKLKFAKQK